MISLRTLLGFIVGLSLPWPLLAGPVQSADIPADPAWVVHLDCDALRPTALGKHILSEMEKPEAQAKLAVFQSVFSFDLRTQLHGITIYSAGPGKEDALVMAYADFDPARLTNFARAAKDSQNTEYKSHVIYNWIDDKKKARQDANPRTYAAIAGKRVILSGREEFVARALDVLDGARPNLGSGQALADWAAAGPGSFLKAAATKLEIAGHDPNAALFKLARRITLQVGESDRQVRAALTLEAKDSEVAGQMTTVAQGLVALLKLQPDKPQAARLAQALSLKQDAARLQASLALPADEVIGLIKAGGVGKAEKKAHQDAQ